MNIPVNKADEIIKKLCIIIIELIIIKKYNYNYENQI